MINTIHTGIRIVVVGQLPNVVERGFVEVEELAIAAVELLSGCVI